MRRRAIGAGPYVGSRRRPLDPAAFYDAVGQQDHAQWYRRRVTTRRALLGSGTALLVGGALSALIGGLIGVIHPFCMQQDQADNCILANRSPNAPALGIGLGAFAAGVTLLAVRGRLQLLPTTMQTNYRLGAEHNRRLRQSLGLPEVEDEAIPPALRKVTRLEIVPMVGPRAAGLAVGGVF